MKWAGEDHRMTKPQGCNPPLHAIVAQHGSSVHFDIQSLGQLRVGICQHADLHAPPACIVVKDSFSHLFEVNVLGGGRAPGGA